MTPDVTPQVVLVITTFDRPDFLREALASAQSQTYPALDIVVSDDGSTDPRMLALLDDLEREGVRVLRHPHGGISHSLHAAVSATDSTYLMVLGDDDLIDAPYVAEAVAVAEHDPSIGMVYCRADLFGDQDGRWDLPDFTIGPLLFDNQIFATMLFRRADWEAVGGYDLDMREGREDHDFLLRLVGLGRRAHRLDGTYFHYRRHGDASLNAVTGLSPTKRSEAYAKIFRNNLDLYAENAEYFWYQIFREREDARDLRLRYRHFEKLRERHPRWYSALRAARRRAESARHGEWRTRATRDSDARRQ